MNRGNAFEATAALGSIPKASTKGTGAGAPCLYSIGAVIVKAATAKGTAMSQQKLAEPIEVAKFWANRRGEAVIVALREYEGAILIDIRRHYTAADGKLQPTSKGMALAIAKLPELALAVNKAVVEARARGFIWKGQ